MPMSFDSARILPDGIEWHHPCHRLLLPHSTSMKKVLTYGQLNDLTHRVSDLVDNLTETEVDRYEVNDLLSEYLQKLGFEFLELDG